MNQELRRGRWKEDNSPLLEVAERELDGARNFGFKDVVGTNSSK